MASRPDSWQLSVAKIRFDKIIFRVRQIDLNALPHQQYPDLVWLTIKRRGYSPSEILDRLDTIESEIQVVSEALHQAILVAVVSRKKTREFLYYVADASEFNATVQRVLTKHPKLLFHFETRREPSWQQYLDLRETTGG